MLDYDWEWKKHLSSRTMHRDVGIDFLPYIMLLILLLSLYPT